MCNLFKDYCLIKIIKGRILNLFLKIIFVIILISYIPHIIHPEEDYIDVITHIKSKNGYEVKYHYDDHRQCVLKNYKSVHLDNIKIDYNEFYDWIDHISGFTKEIIIKDNEEELAAIHPQNTFINYDEHGNIILEEWDTNGDFEVDRFFIYKYDDDLLIEKELYKINVELPISTTYFKYNNDNKLISYYEKDNHFNTRRNYFYNESGEMIRSQWSNNSFQDGFYNLYYYSKQGNQVKIEKYNSVQLLATTNYVYSENNQLISVSDRYTNFQYVYSSLGKLQRIIKKDKRNSISNKMIDLIYDENGYQVSRISKTENDNSEFITHYFYDSDYKLIRLEFTNTDGDEIDWTKISYKKIKPKKCN